LEGCECLLHRLALDDVDVHLDEVLPRRSRGRQREINTVERLERLRFEVSFADEVALAIKRSLRPDVDGLHVPCRGDDIGIHWVAVQALWMQMLHAAWGDLEVHWFPLVFLVFGCTTR